MKEDWRSTAWNLASKMMLTRRVSHIIALARISNAQSEKYLFDGRGLEVKVKCR